MKKLFLVVGLVAGPAGAQEGPSLGEVCQAALLQEAEHAETMQKLLGIISVYEELLMSQTVGIYGDARLRTWEALRNMDSEIGELGAEHFSDPRGHLAFLQEACGLNAPQ